ncbi:FeoA family protein [Parasphingopyxis marina]|uniref:Ferrous iron transport protein A n=1 Tax=Parasphingopyxis marina TaxID=2761622 RepID=A0A842HV07_9SPHN|nr:FeoA family protein [Parasphingopyxis marina]MBC2776221.1 ferrous iron transport protein A [Parasphingopyxis marina]
MSRVILDDLPLNQAARIAAIDWAALAPGDAKRLRELGFDEGVTIEPLHRAPFGRDPVACKVGRMTVAVRRAHALVIQVDVSEPEVEAA